MVKIFKTSGKSGYFILILLTMLLLGMHTLHDMPTTSTSRTMFTMGGPEDAGAITMFNSWNRTWGGTSADRGFSVAVDSAGNVYLAGYTLSFGVGTPFYANAFLNKYAANGTSLWNRTWGGTKDDYGYGVAVATDGIYIAGGTFSFGVSTPAYANAFLAKYAVNGTSLWNRTWGGANDDNGWSVTVAVDGIYMAGDTSSFGAGSDDAFLAKYATNGTSLWNRTWGGVHDDMAWSVAVAADGIYMAGDTNNFGPGTPTYANAFLTKYATNGTSLWNRTWGGAHIDHGRSAAVAADGEYIAGYTDCFGAGSNDAFLAKYAANGTQLWNRTWGGVDVDFGFGVAVAADGIYMTGYTYCFGPGTPPYYNAFLAKYATNGTQVWNSTWGTAGNGDSGWAIAVAGDVVYMAGQIFDFGITDYSAFIAKYIPAYPPGIFTLSSNAGTPDNDGIFTLNWNSSAGASWYSVYTCSALITTINASVQELADQVTTTKFDITTGFGTHYYAIVAKNATGTTLSNSINVTVWTPPGSFTLSSNAGNPDTDGAFTLIWTNSPGASNYTVYVHSRFISEINESLTKRADSITAANLAISGLTDGVYYFLIVARNPAGLRLSNCIVITVTTPIIPPSNDSLILYIGIAAGVVLVIGVVGAVIRKKKNNKKRN